MKNTELTNFCNFLENELRIELTEAQKQMYQEQKSFALVNERNQLVEAYYAGTSQFDNAAKIINPKTPKDYVIETYGTLQD